MADVRGRDEGSLIIRPQGKRLCGEYDVSIERVHGGRGPTLPGAKCCILYFRRMLSGG